MGGWLTRHLAEMGDGVVAIDSEVDVTKADAVRSSVTTTGPDVVYHLAGLAHVGRSWNDPQTTFTVNALGTMNVLEAAAACARPPRVLLVSSAEVYGATGPEPVTEEAPLRPVTPYAASKVAAEYLGLQAFIGRGLPVIRVRPFNHVGPGQSPDFVVPALARRIAEAERRGGGDVAVGNLEAERDFTDVRDVVRGYRLLALEAEAGEAYNVASGEATRVGDLAEMLASQARAPVRLVRDEALVRPVDVPVFVGDASRLVKATRWAPAIPLHETLADVLGYWRSALA